MKSFPTLILLLWSLPVISPLFAKNLPLGSDTEVLEEVKSNAVNRRNAYSDQSTERLTARVGLAREEIGAKRYSQALTWVKEYENPIPENLNWPTVQGYVEAAKARAGMGQTFDAVQRLEKAKEKSPGLGRVLTLHVLSELIQEQPNLKKALALEKQALSDGEAFFKRRKISDTAGLEPAKEGHKIWAAWKPLIEERIQELENLVEIETYGLDYVLYLRAQKLRNANHPLAFDFTDVKAAFDLKSKGSEIENADFEEARAQYQEIIAQFPQSVYSEASELYAAVCLAHLGEQDAAIRELSAFYKENPDGLYRGEALNVLGNIYLTSKWDRRNAKAAYSRSIAWVEAVRGRDRILDTYVVPEKSAEITRPPRQPEEMGLSGEILRKVIPINALVNRMTSDWYLDRLMTELEWKMGFLEFLEGNIEAAKSHFGVALEHDPLVRQAHNQGDYNIYKRMMLVLDRDTLIMSAEEMKGLSDKVKLVNEWADLHFLLENFNRAGALYRLIQSAARQADNGNALVRATLAENLLKRAAKDESRRQDGLKMYNIAMKFPDAPSTPYLLMRCAYLARTIPLSGEEIMRQVYTEYPKSHQAVLARYNYILRHVPRFDDEKRIAAIQAFVRDYPNETKIHELLLRFENRTRAEPLIKKKIEEAQAAAGSKEISLTIDIPDSVTLEELMRE